MASGQQEANGAGTAINVDPIRSALTAKLLAYEGDRPAELLGALLDNIGGPALPRQMGDYLEALRRPKGRLQIRFPYDSRLMIQDGAGLSFSRLGVRRQQTQGNR